MTDKIRIVGAFGVDAVGKVQEFVKGLEGVESVSVLHDGVETYREADTAATAAGTGEGEATGTTTGAETVPDESLSKA